MKSQIIWEKWIDPFGQDDDVSKWTEYDDEYQEYDHDERVENSPKRSKQIRVIASPMGIIPYNEYSAPGKLFNFWVGHTNFNITSDIITVIEKTTGVEILDIFSRYRFRIAVGKCFNDSDIKKEIMDNIYNFMETIHGTNS
jgi:hypothetical protein